jgi:glycerol kinase
VLESVAFLIKANLDEMDRHRPTAARLVVSGGLAENRLLCRMLACLAESPVDRGSDREATSRGLAFLVAGSPADFRGPASSASSRSTTSACWRAISSGSR